MIPVLSGKYIKKSHKQFIVTIILFNKRLKKKKRIHNKNKRCFYETYVIIYFFQYFRTSEKFTFVLKNMNILCHDQRRTLCNVKTKQRMKSNYLVIIITANEWAVLYFSNDSNTNCRGLHWNKYKFTYIITIILK